MKKLLLLLVALIAASVMLTGCGKEESKIGYVDINRVVTEAPKVKALNEEFEKQNAALEKEKQELVAKQNTMKPEEFQKKVMEFQAKKQSVNANLQGQFTSLVEPVYADILANKGLSVIMRKQDMYQQKTVEYGGVDITDDVIEKLK